MDWTDAKRVINDFASFGTRAATITGGGEPLLYAKLPDTIRHFYMLGIKVGLVTNGLYLDRLSRYELEMLTWCRISSSDSREFTGQYRSMLERVVGATSTVDWGFSHVVSRSPNYTTMKNVVEFANEHDFTHVRLTADILDAERVDLIPVREYLAGKDEKVIYQPRDESEKSSSCIIGYVKPLVAPDFKMYLCCGVQYALNSPTRDMPDELCMGDARDLQSVYADRKPFDVWCTRCFYGDYNRMLGTQFTDLRHVEFV